MWNKINLDIKIKYALKKYRYFNSLLFLLFFYLFTQQPLQQWQSFSAAGLAMSNPPGRDLEPGLEVRPRARITSTSSWPFLSIRPIWTSPAHKDKTQRGSSDLLLLLELLLSCVEHFWRQQLLTHRGSGQGLPSHQLTRTQTIQEVAELTVSTQSHPWEDQTDHRHRHTHSTMSDTLKNKWHKNNTVRKASVRNSHTTHSEQVTANQLVQEISGNN